MALREYFGQDILAKLIAQDVIAERQKIWLSLMASAASATSPILKDLPGFVLVSIAADEKIRYERLIARGQKQWW